MLTRRAALQGGTATVAAIAGAGAVAAPVADPVLDLLEEVEQLTTVWYATDEWRDERRYRALEKHYHELWCRLRETHAGTLQGALAKFKYFSRELSGNLETGFTESVLQDFERLVGEG